MVLDCLCSSQIHTCMKRIVFLLLIAASVKAQTNDQPVKLEHYVMDKFTPGTVLLKSGARYQQVLNYNIITREMIFDNSGTFLAIANPKDVDTVFIDGRKFVPVGDGFYEWLGGTTVPLFADYTYTLKEEGVNTGFGKSTTSAAVSTKALLKDGGAYRLKLPDEFQVIPGKTFYIRKSDRYHKVGNEQQVSKIFPEHKQRIADYVKENRTNFTRVSDMQLLINQLN